MSDIIASLLGNNVGTLCVTEISFEGTNPDAGHLYFNKEMRGRIMHCNHRRLSNGNILKMTHIEIIADFRSPANGLSCKREGASFLCSVLILEHLVTLEQHAL